MMPDGGREHERSPRALDAAPEDHQRSAGRKSGHYRTDGEDRRPEQVVAHRPPRVGEPPDGDKEHARHQQVGRLGPQTLRVAQMQVGAHGRQGHGDDAGVEGGHERPDGHDRQRVPPAALELGLVAGRHSGSAPPFRGLLGVQLIDEPQELLVAGDVAHVVAVVHEARHPGFVDEHLGRHAAELEQLDLLPILLEDLVLGIRQPNERQVVLSPVSRERLGVLGAHDHYRRLPLLELLIVLAQLRHVPTAERSGETPIEHEEHVTLAPQVGKVEGPAAVVRKFEVGCWYIERDARHLFSSFSPL